MKRERQLKNLWGWGLYFSKIQTFYPRFFLLFLHKTCYRFLAKNTFACVSYTARLWYNIYKVCAKNL
jgi:hypothetical protein